MTWLIRVFLLAGGFIAGFFVTKESESFPIISVIASLLLLTALVSLWAFWPNLCRFWRNITHKEPNSGDQ